MTKRKNTDETLDARVPDWRNSLCALTVILGLPPLPVRQIKGCYRRPIAAGERPGCGSRRLKGACQTTFPDADHRPSAPPQATTNLGISSSIGCNFASENSE